MASRRMKQFMAAKQSEALARMLPALEGFADAMGWAGDGAQVDKAVCVKAMREVEKALAEDENAIVLPNPDRESFFEKPFVIARVRSEGVKLSENMSCEQFMAAAAFPGWNDRLFSATMLNAENAPGNNPAFVGYDPARAELCKNEPLGFGAMEFPAGEAASRHVHFLYDQAGGKAVMVGDDLSDQQRNALTMAGVVYCRAEDVAPTPNVGGNAKAKKLLGPVFNNISQPRQSALVEALSHRNSGGGWPLDEMLTRPGKVNPTAMPRYRLK